MKAELSLPPVGILNDYPATDQVDFGYDIYADTLAGLIANKENSTPLTMGIYGPWGSGKTTLMNAIKARLDNDRLVDVERHRQCFTVWFQAWKHDRDEEVLAALIETIFKAMAAHGFFTLARVKVEAISRRIDQSKVFTSISKLVTGMDVSEFFAELPHKEQLAYYDTFQKFMDDLLWTFLNWRFKLNGMEKPDDKKCAMVIFIDDLDRCRPGLIVKTLETIKLFMDRSGCIFVLGACHVALEDALAERYGPAEAGLLLEKVVPTSFHLPQLSVESFGSFMADQAGDMAILAEYMPMLVPALGHNPRRIKRFINNLNLIDGLLRNADMTVAFEKVVCWGIIANVFVELADEIHDNPDEWFTLQKHIARLSDNFKGQPLWRISDDQLKAEKVPRQLHRYIQQPGLVEVVARCDLSAQAFDRMRYLSSAFR